MPSLSSLLKRAQKLERRESLQTLLNTIGERSLSPSQQMQFLARIMALTASGRITPREAQTLTKAVKGARYETR